MRNKSKIIISILLISGCLLNICSAQNIQDNKYETFTKPQLFKSQQDIPEEAQSDINSLNNIKYLKTKTNMKLHLHMKMEHTHI